MLFRTFRENVIALVILGLLLTISHAVMEFFNSLKRLIPMRYIRYDILVNLLWFLVLLAVLIGMVYLMKGTTDFQVGLPAIATASPVPAPVPVLDKKSFYY
jgi:hypothetical protein